MMDEMEREDYIAIVEYLKEKLAEHGLHDIAKDRHYMKADEGGIYRLPPPETHAFALLQAFRRHVNINSLETLDKALYKIRAHSSGPTLETIRIESLDRSEPTDPLFVADKTFYDLAQAPSRKELIGRIDSLIDRLFPSMEGGIRE